MPSCGGRNGGAQDSVQKLQLVLSLCQELGVSTRWGLGLSTKPDPALAFTPKSDPAARLRPHTGTCRTTLCAIVDRLEP